MKSNDERVHSIVDKAKHYKSERKKVLSALTVTLCAVVVAITTYVRFYNVDKTGKSLTPNNNLVVATNYMVEKYLPTFESKEQLLDCLNEKAKKNETRYYKLNSSDDMISSVDMIGDVAMETASDSKNEMSVEKGDSSYSETNTQVQGVDESDIVKTNGKNIFYLSSRDNTLSVFDSQSDEIKLVHEMKLDGELYNNQMYLDDNFIVVLSDARIIDGNNKKMDCVYYGGRSSAKISIYDINTYELVREIETEGNIVSSRKIGEDMYIVTNKYVSLYNIDEDNILPLYKDTCESGEYIEISATDIRYFDDFKNDDDCSYMIVTSFSLGDMDSKVNINTYLGAGTEVYCSKENLYVAKVDYEYSIFNGLRSLISTKYNGEDNTTTSIHKFAINDGDIKYIATGKVDGSLLNQFSMDEYDGYFRITTTDNSAGNNLFVLDKNLEKVGSVENLASGERIYATRFMGDKAYVVTYKTVDPLFVIDLSTPESPKVLGELKIPGYSSYLHPLGENYLIGFGEDSVEKSYLNWEGKEEVVAYSTGLKMAIFDVSDYSNPKEIYSIKIGGRGSYSELLYNHKVLLFNEEEGIIAFPASVTKEAGNYDNGVPMYGETIFNGALVYNISVEEGITLRGKISHTSDNKYDNRIERIIYIGDKLYTISNNMIMSSDIETVEKIDELKF